MTNDRQNTHFDDEGLLFSRQFDDHYFSRNGGSTECVHVFIDGNNLTDRWRNGLNFNIGELGFGTSLNFLKTWDIWCQTRQPGQLLTFTSAEAFPLDRETATQALAPYQELAEFRDKMLDQWPDQHHDSLPHVSWQADSQTRLLVVALPVEDALDEFSDIDAWYLDGFAPARNPDMWSLPVMQAIAERSNAKATFASYTAAGWVRRNLQAAGFDVEKRPGFGTKRDMIAGQLR